MNTVLLAPPQEPLYVDQLDFSEKESSTFKEVPLGRGSCMSSTEKSLVSNGKSLMEILLSPVQYTLEGNIKLVRELMEVDSPYPIRLEDIFLVAIKRRDGTVEFYSLPS